MKNTTLALVALVSAGIAGISTQAHAARDSISIVGSSTVYPFSTTVAEQFGKTSKFKTPKVESTGTGGGMQLFCNGVGVDTPDMTNASRRIKDSEYQQCQDNGVKDIVEVKIGYDGIVMANSKEAAELKLSLKDIYLALAKNIPNPDGSEGAVPNPNKTWKDVNSSLPDNKIEVLGPPPTSGTRDAFAELAMEGGCKTFDWIKALKDSDEDAFKAQCHTIREDGAYVEAGENDNLIVQKLESNTKAVGIFGYSFLEQNEDKLQGSAVENVVPSFEDIASGDYVLSRPLFFYVKKAHVGVIPGIKEYLAEFTSEKAWGPDGYLSDKGLIPLPDSERSGVASSVNGLTLLKLTAK